MKPFYAKYLPAAAWRDNAADPLPDSYSATAWEAAAKLAFHLQTQAELPPKALRGPRRPSEVSLPVPACALTNVSRHHVYARMSQEVQLEKQEKKAKLAKVAAKLAAGSDENMPVQPAVLVPTGLSNAPVAVAVPFGSLVAMQPIASPLPTVPVMLAPER